MARLPPELLRALDNNARRQRVGGVIEAAVGATLGLGGLAGTIYRSHNGWFGEQNGNASRKRLREHLENVSSKKSKLQESLPKYSTNSKARASLSDSTANAQVVMSNGAGEGSGNAAGLKETPIDDPYVVYRGPPDYTYASLPYIREEWTKFNNIYAYDHIYRMTSPYDAYNSLATQDLNAGTGTANWRTAGTDGTQQSARWFDYYAGLYKYYHVVSCRWVVSIENQSMEPFYAHRFFVNDTIPSGGATNEDIMLWDGVESKYVPPVGISITTSGQRQTSGFAGDTDDTANYNAESGPPNPAINQTYANGDMLNYDMAPRVTFSGEYRPGDFRREVRLDSEVENWTLCTTNPALPERLIIRICPNAQGIDTNDVNNYGDDLKYRIRVKLEYLVEFKELVDGLRWPLQRQPLTVTIAQDLESVN